MKFRVLATARSFCNTPGPHLSYLRDNDCQLDLRAQAQPLSATQLSQLIPGYDGVILGLDDCNSSVLKQADKLKVISRYGVGVDKVDLAVAASRGIVVTNTPGTNTIAVAELTVALIYALARNIPQVANAARSGSWQRELGWELFGKTLGLIGFGAIGQEVALRLAASGMTVLAYDPYFQGEVNGVQISALQALIKSANIISLHAALTPDTHKLISRERLAQMKDGSYLINTARGGLVDEEALFDALKSGKLAGAAMDAFVQEPPIDNPLLRLDNFIATPHIGATTREAVARMSLLAAHNLLDVLTGKANPHIVNQALLNAAKEKS